MLPDFARLAAPVPLLVALLGCSSTTASEDPPAPSLLAIVDDPQRPLGSRIEAADALAESAAENATLCAELLRRTGPDPVGEAIRHALLPNNRCRKEWGPEIATHLLQERDACSFTLYSWLSCDYLRSHPALASQVLQCTDYDLATDLGSRATECQIRSMQEEVFKELKNVQPHLSYAQDGDEPVRLQLVSVLAERGGDGAKVLVAAVPYKLSYAIYDLFLKIVPNRDDNNVDGLFRIGSLESPWLCTAVGRFVSGSAVLRTAGPREILSFDLTFSVVPCRGGKPTTVKMTAEQIVAWPVVDLYEYVEADKGAPESAADIARLWEESRPAKQSAETERP